MSPELVRIINLFNRAQARAIDVLEQDFGCPRPIDCMDFIGRCVPIIRDKNYIANGRKIRPHGIGMVVETEKEKIDFDFGKNGEFTGFDSYRLANYIRLNKVQTTLDSEEKVKKEFEKAIKSSLLRKGTGMGNVYYLNS